MRIYLVEGASGQAPGYNFAGINDSDKFFTGIQSSISYANPNVIGSQSFSLEGLMLKDATSSPYSWVEAGWVKDNRYSMTMPYGFLENKQGSSYTYTYFTISPSTHNYKLVYVGQTADYRYVYACYYDGVWEARGFVYSQDLFPEAKGEVYNSTSSYSQMGPASISNIQLLHSGSWILWQNSYPTLHTGYFENNPPYHLTILNLFYNIYNTFQS
ncbi:hypothetical protein [Caldisericum sp.]|uniref:hypothetical protein n=1 Tax=Caldisericum sp. TaxID=2499687 RepID=UPI003D0A06B9